jgi:hypothetical protein
LNGFNICGGGRGRFRAVVEVREVGDTLSWEFEGSSRGMVVGMAMETWPAGVSKRCGVDVHSGRDSTVK